MAEPEVTTEEVAEEVEETTEEVAEETVETEEVVEELKPKQTAQERINEITRLRRDAERRAERAEARLAERERIEKAPARGEPGPRPIIDQFETTEAYEDALFEWRDSARDQKLAAERMAREHDEQLITFNSRATKLRKEHPDFDDIVESPVFTPNMRMAILSSEKGPELAYHLGLPENRAEAERIQRLSNHVQLFEMGKLEQTLSIVRKTRTTTSAPEPIKPVGITGKGETDPSKMSTAEWMAWEKERVLAKHKKKLGVPV